MNSILSCCIITALVALAQAQDHCKLCMFGVQVLQQGAMDFNTSAVDIELVLNDICEQVQETSVDECKHVASDLVRKVMPNLTRVSASQICGATTLCEAPKVTTGIICTMCKDVVKGFEGLIKASVVGMLTGMCQAVKNIPGVGTACSSFDTHVQNMVDKFFGSLCKCHTPAVIASANTL